MAFNNALQPIWVDAGQTICWWYSFGPNLGLQVASANPLSSGSAMESTGQSVTLNTDGTTTYAVCLTNIGPLPCLHNLNGGGAL